MGRLELLVNVIKQILHLHKLCYWEGSSYLGCIEKMNLSNLFICLHLKNLPEAEGIKGWLVIGIAGLRIFVLVWLANDIRVRAKVETLAKTNSIRSQECNRRSCRRWSANSDDRIIDETCLSCACSDPYIRFLEVWRSMYVIIWRLQFWCIPNC